jgi:Mg2+ and Co2+ transporter CorA
MGPTDDRAQAVAEEIAERVGSTDGRRGGWFEVRALMGAFGIERYSEEAQARMTTALESVGLELDPPLSELDRSETVVLSPKTVQMAATPRRPLTEVLTVRVLAPGGAIRQVSLEELSRIRDASDQEVRWFDLSATADLHIQEVFESLAPYCAANVTLEIFEDLLSPDPRPRVKNLGAGIRCVSAFRVEACESDDGAKPESTSKAGILKFEPVELLVGDRWLITCWHDIEIYRGADRISENDPAPPADLFHEVERCWPSSQMSTASDLALLVLHELALTYAPAYRQFYDWLEEWELDFYRRPKRIDRDTLLEVRAAAAILRDWLGPLNPPGMREDARKAWFPHITGSSSEGAYKKALKVDDRIDRALAGLRDFNDTIRSAYDLLQLRERERERERDDDFQRTIAVGGSAILIPTLVAGIMGANTWVPGQWREENGPPHWAFAVLVAIVMASGFFAWLVIHRAHRRDRAD